MKKLLFLTAVSLTCLNFNAEAMDPFTEELKPGSMSIKLSSAPKAPITTGFFDKTLTDTTIDTKEKLKQALAHVTVRREKYELFIEQIGATYFRTKFLQDETLNNYAVLMMSYFEEKLERLEKKYAHFRAYLEDVSSFTKERNTANPIGKYSGVHHGDQASKSEYAHSKIKTWDIIFSFVDQFPITKVSTSSIIQRAIEAEAQKRVNAFEKIEIFRPDDVSGLKKYHNDMFYDKYDLQKLKSSAKADINIVAKQNPVLQLNDIIDNSYDLKSYSEEHLKKWRTRIGEKQKIDILSDKLKSLNVIKNELEEGPKNLLAIKWQSNQPQ